VLLGIPDGDRIILIDREESPDPMKVTAPIGLRIPSCAGSFGKVLLSPDDLDRLFPSGELPTFTKHSITNLQDFKMEQVKAREQRYAIDIEEYLEGVRAVSAPIFGRGEKAIAAVTVVGFAAKMPEERMASIVEETIKAGDEISRRMGFHPRRSQPQVAQAR
jgi:DNA-binding IclR family transcriptional regulator